MKAECIVKNEIPVNLKGPRSIETRDAMTDAKFDTIMEKGLKQAKADDSKSAKDVFTDLKLF